MAKEQGCKLFGVSQNFGGPRNERCRHIICPFGIFYGPLKYFMAL
jgi:hypothetical protein